MGLFMDQTLVLLVCLSITVLIPHYFNYLFASKANPSTLFLFKHPGYFFPPFGFPNKF